MSAASAIVLCLSAPAYATTTVNGGTTLDLGGGVVSDTALVLIDGNLTNGQFNASESFDVRNGTISATLFGFGAMTKTTTGVVVLSNANGYSGGTEIFDGTLRLENSSALGLGGVTVQGGDFDLANGLAVPNSVVLDDADFIANVGSGTATWSGAIAQLTTPRGLTKTGAGVLTLTAANSYTGETKINAGTLLLSGAGTLGAPGGDVTIDDGATLDVTDTAQSFGTVTLTGGGTIQGKLFGAFPLGTITADAYDVMTAAGKTAALDVYISGNGTITKDGAGTLRVNALNLGYTGTVELNEGTLFLQRQAALGGTLNGATVNANGAVTIDYGSGQNQYQSVVLNDAAVKFNVDVNIGVQHGDISGAFGIEKTGAAALGFGSAMSYTGVTTISGGSINLMNGLPGQYGSIGGNIALTGGYLALSRTDNALDLTGDISGSGQIVTDYAFGSGTLSGNNTFGGGIFLFGGKIRAGSSTAFGTGPVGGLAGTTIDLNGFDITTGGLSGGGLVDLTGKTLTLNMPGFNYTVFGGTVTAGHIVKTGSGTLELSDSNDLSALLSMTINGGTLALSGSQNIAGAPVFLNAGGTLDLSGLSPGEIEFTDLQGSGNIELGATQLQLSNGGNYTLSGTISGAGGSLMKSGAGILTLSGANTFDGGIALTSGTLLLASNGAAGTGPITTTGSVISYANGVNNAAPIVINSNTTQLEVLPGATGIQSGVISELAGPRPLEIIGGGTMVLAADNTYTGKTTVSAGNLYLGYFTSTGSVAGDIELTNFGTNLLVLRTNDLTIGGNISGNGAIAKSAGAATVLELSGNNTYKGGTAVNLGTVRAGSSTAFGTGYLFAASGATVDLNGYDITALNATGAGTFDLTGRTLTLTGGGTANGTIFTAGNLNIANGADLTFNSVNLSPISTLTVDGTIRLSGATSGAPGTIDLASASGLFDISGLAGPDYTADNISGAGAIELGAKTLIAGGSNNSFALSGVISGTGGFTKTGSGVLTMTGVNTFTGQTTINQGRVILADNGQLAGDVFIANTGPNEFLEFAKSVDSTYGGVLSGGNVAHSGSGTTTWTGANTNAYTGVAAGTLKLDGAGTLGASNGWVIVSGGTIDLNGTTQSLATLTMLDGGTGTVTGGNVNVSSIIYADSGTISANLGGSATLAKFSAGTSTLSGTNTYTGQTTIYGGTLVLQSGSALDDMNAVTVATGATLQLDGDETIGSLAGGGNLALTTKSLTTGGNNTDTLWTGTIFGGATSSLQKVGTGKFFVVGNMNQESTTVQAGELNFNGTALGNIAVNAGAKLSGTNTINGDLINLGTVASGNSPGTTTVLGNYTGGGTLDVEVQFDNAGSPINGTTHDFLNISGNVLGAPTAINLLTYAPSGSPAATTGNGIEIVRVGGSSTAADFTMTSYLLGSYYYNLAYLSNYIGGTVDSFFLQSSLVTPGCSVDNGDNACFIDAAANLLGTPVDALAGNDTLQLNGAADFTFDVARLGTTYTNFEVFQKADANTVTLTGTMANASQGIDIQNGTLVAGTGNLGSEGRVNIFTPGLLQVASDLIVGSIAGSGDVALGANTLTVGGDNTSSLFSGVISGTGDFQKQGAGILTLSGVNTFTGNLNLNDGGITVASGGTLGAATIDLFVQGTLDLGGTAQTVGSLGMSVGSIQNGALTVNGNAFAQDGTISADLTVTGNFSKAFGSGSLALSGTNTFSSVNVGEGTLIAANDAAITDTASVNLSYIGFGVGPTLQIQSNQTIGGLSGDMFSALNLGAFNLTTGGNNASTAFDGVVSSTTGKLVKTGTGMLTLSGNNIFSFAGGIDLMQGTLRLASNTAAGTGPITTFGSVIDYASGIDNAAPVVINSATTQFQVLAGSASQSGVISELGGPRPFEKIGAGELILSGTNTFTGATSITAGTLSVQNGAALSDASAVTVASGATLALLSNETIGSLSGAGGVTLNANTLSAGGNGASTTFSGVISGVGGQLTKQGSGTLTLTGANTFTGGLEAAAGTISLANNAAAGAGTIRASGGVIDIVNGVVTSAGIQLNAANTQIQVLAGQAVQSGAISQIGGARGLEKIGGGYLVLSSANAYTGLTTVADGQLQLTAAGAVSDAVNVTGSSAALVFAQNGVYNYGGSISGTNVVQLGTGTTVLSGVNAHSYTAITGGTLQLSGAGTLGGSTVLVELAGLTPGTTLNLGGTTQTVGSLVLNGGPLYDQSVINGTINVATSIQADKGLISANLGGAAALTKSGSDTTTLSGANAYSGGTTINGGTLVLQGGSAIADLGVVTVNAGGAVQFANNETVGSLGGAGAVVLGANTLTLGGNNGSTTISGAISGAGGKLVKQGTGMLTLSGANSFSGGIDVYHGTLTLGSNLAAGTGPITTYGTVINYLNLVNNAAPIVISSNTTQLQQIGGTATQSGPISEIGGSRPLEKIGNGNLTLSGVNTFTGPMTISDGTLTLQGGAALADGVAVIVASPGALALNTSETVGSLAGSGALTMSAGTALTAGGDNSSTLFAGTMTGGGFTKAGNGTFTFTGVGVYGGPLNVASGVFTKTGGGMSGATAFNVASGATAFLGATAAGVNGAGIAATGMGAIALNGTTYLDDNTLLTGSSLTMGTSPALGVFLTTNTSVYPQIAVSGAAGVSGALNVYLDPLSFGSTLATTFNYDNVISGASRSGTFSSVNLSLSPSGLFSVSAVYGTNDVDLTVVRSSFASLGGGGGNAPEVGGGVEEIYVIGTTDPDLLNLIATIGSSSPSAISAIYAAISGSTSAETSGGGLRTDDPWKQTVAERINAARAPGCTVAGDAWCLRRYAQAPSPVMSDVQGDAAAFDWLDTGIRDAGTSSAWLRAVGSWSALEGSDYAPGSKQTTGGLIGGADHVFDSLFLAGVAGQYLETSADFDESPNKSHIRSAQLGAYASYGGAEAYLNANASVIATQARSERFATVGLLNYEFNSFMRGLALTASAEAGTILEIDGYRFEPSAALNYQYGMTDDYAERGGGGLSLLVRPDDTQSLRSILSARLSRVFDAGDRKIVPQLRIDWRHEHLDRGQSFDAAFAGAPDVLFHVEGNSYARDQLAVGAGVTVPLTGRLTGYADALGTFSEDTTSGTVLVGVRASW